MGADVRYRNHTDQRRRLCLLELAVHSGVWANVTRTGMATTRREGGYTPHRAHVKVLPSSAARTQSGGRTIPGIVRRKQITKVIWGLRSN